MTSVSPTWRPLFEDLCGAFFAEDPLGLELDRTSILKRPDRPLLALACLAKGLQTMEVLRPAFKSGAVTVLEVETEYLISDYCSIIRKGLTSLAHPDPLSVVSLERSVNVSRPTEIKVRDHYFEALDRQCGFVLVGPPKMVFPEQFRGLMPAPIKVPPFDREILLVVLDALKDRNIHYDLERLQKVLPSDDHLRAADPTAMVLALRSENIETLERYLISLGATIPESTTGSTDSAAHQHRGIAGVGQAQAYARRLVRSLKQFKEGQGDWTRVPSSLLLYGPPGTGKTHLARQVALDAGVPLHAFSVADFEGVGVFNLVLQRMKESVDDAIGAAPCVFFIDEIDSFGTRLIDNGRETAYVSGLINAFLTSVDRLKRTPGVVIMGATNVLTQLDPAIIRPGRFDLRAEMSTTDAELLKAVVHDAFGEISDADEIVDLMYGQTAAEAGAFIRLAFASIESDDLSVIVKELKSVLTKQRSIRRAADHRVAYHEAGHAVASTAINWQPVALCEVQFNGEGRTDYDLRPSEYRLKDIHREVAVLLAGRASEELFLGDISSGSGGGPQSDLAIATKLLTAIDNQSGLGRSGLVWRQDAVMDDEAEARIRGLLNALYGSIRGVLKANEEAVHRLAEVLIAYRKIEGAPLNEILQKVKHHDYDLL